MARRKEQVMNKNILGIHGNLLRSDVRYGSDELVKAWDRNGFHYLRLPGGSSNHWYQWKTGIFHENNWSFVGDTSEKDRYMIFGANKARETHGAYLVNDMIDFLIETGTEYSYVVNAAEPFQNHRDFLKHWKASGLDLKNVEYGNEMYTPQKYAEFENVQMYTDKAKNFNYVLKQDFPDAKLGLTVSMEAFKPHKPGAKRDELLHWDEGIRNQEWRDANIIHFYATPAVNSAWGKWSANEVSYYTALNHWNKYFEEAVSTWDDKPIWVTEWGVYPWPRTQGEPELYSYLSSKYNHLFVAHALIEMMLEPRITLAAYHSWTQLLEGSGINAELAEPGCNATKEVFKVFGELTNETPERVGIRGHGCTGVKLGNTLILVNRMDQKNIVEGCEVPAHSVIVRKYV